MRRLSAGRALHHLDEGAHDPRWTPRSAADRARQRQSDPTWKADYTATRPKVERKIAHLMRRKHGGRRARVRGQTKTAADFKLLAGAVNLARLAALGLTHQDGAWAANTA
jgi:hypothetical protein